MSQLRMLSGRRVLHRDALDKLLMLTLSQVAARLSVSRTTVRRLKDAGELPYSLVSKRCVRFREEDVEAYEGTYIHDSLPFVGKYLTPVRDLSTIGL